MEQTKRNINDLQNWDKNPKTITEKGMERLIRQLRILGQYKPLLALPDGTVIGGNSRLRAYRTMLNEAKESGDVKEIEKYSNIWVSEIDFVEDANGTWFAIVNGELQENGFPYKETGMLEYAMSDHDEPGAYNEGELANMVDQYEVNTSLYGVHFGEPIVIDDITAPSENEEDSPTKFTKEVVCPECHAKFTPK